MPSLIELEAEFHVYGEKTATWTRVKPGADPLDPNAPTEQHTGPQAFMQRVDTLAEAQGVWFRCPLCYAKNKGPVGTHWVDVTFRGKGVPDKLGSHDSSGKPSRWQVVSGSGLADLVLAPSVHLAGAGGCGWHGFCGMAGVPPGHAR